MAPTIIVADDENAGDVAARLLEIADHQRQVKTRTDLSKLAFDVPDHVYDKYVGKADRPDDEQRENSVQRAAAEQGDPDVTVPADGDELPDLAKVGEPGEGDDQGATLVGDELPDLAKVVDPPANGEYPADGQGGDPETDDGDQGDAEPVDEKPAPKKRASRAKKAAAPAATSTENKGA